MKIKRTSTAKGQASQSGSKPNRPQTRGRAATVAAAPAALHDPHAAADALLRQNPPKALAAQGRGRRRADGLAALDHPDFAHAPSSSADPASLGPPSGALALSIVEMGDALAAAGGKGGAKTALRQVRTARLAAQAFVDDPTVAQS